MSRFCLACIFFIGWLAANNFGSQATAASPPVQYLVSFSDADRHLIDVEVTVPIEGETVELMMPVWTPGSYLVREYARNIESITAFDATTAEPLEIRKSAKNRWVVTGGDGTETVKVRYRLYCREMSVRTNWVEHDFAVLVGAGTFVTGTEMLDRPHHAGQGGARQGRLFSGILYLRYHRQHPLCENHTVCYFTRPNGYGCGFGRILRPF